MRSLRYAVPVAMLLTACAGINAPRVYGTRDEPHPRVGPVSTVPDRDPSIDPGRGNVPTTPGLGAANDAAAEERRICRNAARPSGYVAVAYVAGTNECVGSRNHDGTSYSVVVLTRTTNRPINAELDICADQRTPAGWVDQTDVGGTDQCPGASSSAGATTRRIRRVR